MIVPVIGIVVNMRMRMAGAVGVLVLMLVEFDPKATTECAGDPAQGCEARYMIASLQARDHRFGHSEALRQRPLRLARVGAKLDETASTFARDHGTVVHDAPARGLFASFFHGDLARLRS